MIARNFSQRPAELYGLDIEADPGIALDFDRLHSLRLQIFDSVLAQAQAEAIKGGSDYGANAPPTRYGSDEIGSLFPESTNN